ncbi:MAG: hypothetical protein H6912_00690 [Kordiimonadaceae bacterium]|nr:hypothetical protein [Kordiimonadaceae bacterium]
MSRKKFESAFEIMEQAEILFPLFSAEGEKLWVPDWDYIAVSEGKELHEDYVFMTSNHDFATTNAIWLVKRYDPENYYVQFYKIEPEDKIAIVTVSCTKLGEENTQVTVCYEYIGLSKKGRDFIEDHGQGDFEAFIKEWKILLEQYLNAL